MKQVVRFAIAGALMVGYATAQAQTQPSSNASDLWLFVSDQTAGTTFAVDTGKALTDILPTSSLAPGGSATVLSTSVQANFSIGPTAALTSYINAANTAGHTLEWGVDAANFPGVTTAKGNQKPGGIVALFDNPVSQEANTSGLVFGNMQTFAGGLQGDLGFFVIPGSGAQQAAYVAGGQTYKISAGTSGASVWGTGTGNIGGSTDMYGQGPNQAGIGLGQNAAFYGITGNSANGGQVQSYVLSLLTLTANGTLQTSPLISTPLPAAVWLFGSGLLGLIGVGRRRATAA
jgi:hypothetical protein